MSLEELNVFDITPCTSSNRKFKTYSGGFFEKYFFYGLAKTATIKMVSVVGMDGKQMIVRYVVHGAPYDDYAEAWIAKTYYKDSEAYKAAMEKKEAAK